MNVTGKCDQFLFDQYVVDFVSLFFLWPVFFSSFLFFLLWKKCWTLCIFNEHMYLARVDVRIKAGFCAPAPWWIGSRYLNGLSEIFFFFILGLCGLAFEFLYVCELLSHMKRAVLPEWVIRCYYWPPTAGSSLPGSLSLYLLISLSWTTTVKLKTNGRRRRRRLLTFACKCGGSAWVKFVAAFHACSIWADSTVEYWANGRESWCCT